MISPWITGPAAVLGLVMVGLLLRRAILRGNARRLLEARSNGPSAGDEVGVSIPEGGLSRWLFLAGDRDPGAVTRFLLRTALTTLGALAIVAVLDMLDVFATMMVWIDETPAGLGDGLRPILVAAPWILIVLLASIPYLRVQRERRAIVRSVQAELPNALELLASLAQAGLALDAAAARLLALLDDDHPLAEELRLWQAEALSGRGRVACLRRLAERLDVPQMNRFTAALIQAEQIGSGVSDTLRIQAQDIRNDLRERALMRAQALPTKLVFPLVICFLPGVFIATLGPAFSSFLEQTAPFAEAIEPVGTSQTPSRAPGTLFLPIQYEDGR